MKYLILVLILIVILGIISATVIFYFSKQKNLEKNNIIPKIEREHVVPKTENNIIENKEKNMKRVAFIIAFKNFRDEEYFVPKEILEKANIETKTISTKVGIATGAGGGEVQIDLKLDDLKISDFDAIIFIGGPGALKHLDNKKSYEIIKATSENNKILAAICISPVILAKAGVLKNKKATVWSSVLDKSPINILKNYEAIYQDKTVVVDEKIITANGPLAAKEFGETILKILNSQ